MLGPEPQRQTEALFIARRRSADLDQLPFRLTTHTTRPTTTATSSIGTQDPPYPPIQLPSHMPPFIMFPDCAQARPEFKSGAVATAEASKIFIIVP